MSDDACARLGYNPEYCPLNRDRRFDERLWFAVRSNTACPANQAQFDPKGTFAGWYDDAARALQLPYGRSGAICPHGAARAWFDGLMAALRASPPDAFTTARVVRHIDVAVELGFAAWLEHDQEVVA
jgi:hypothetical protein